MDWSGMSKICRGVSTSKTAIVQKSLLHVTHIPFHGIRRRNVLLVQARGRKSKEAEAPPPPPPAPVEEEESAVVSAGHAEAFEEDVVVERTLMESVPAGPPQYPIAPPPVVHAESGLPPWVWVMVGILLANVFNKVLDFVRRPKEVMSEMMMKQMANAMNSQMGGTPGAGGAPPNPFGFPPPPAAGTQVPPAFDTWASPAAPPPPPPPPPPPQPAAPKPTSSKSTSAPSGDGLNGSVSGFDPAGISGEPAAASAKASSTNGTAAAEPQPSSSFFEDVDGGAAKGGGGATSAGAPQPDDSMVDSFFEAMKDPTMRESLYQYLPEGMRNPETMEMVMNNPMVRDQFKKMMAEKGGLDGMQAAAAAGGASFPGQDGEINKQLESMNIDPQVLVQKLMAEPDLWSLLQKPTVMNAVMDMQQNPNNVTKYMSDPEVMKVLMKMNELTFAAQAEAGGAPPGTPPAGMMPNMPPTPPPTQAPAADQKA